MKTIVYLIGIIVLWSQFGCGSTERFASRTLAQETRVHQEIALIPVQIQYDGPLPAFLEKEGLDKWEQRESQILTEDLYKAFLDRNHQNVMVLVQSPARTRALLGKAGIEWNQLDSVNKRELAKALGVDAIVQTKVSEHRYYEERFPAGRWMESAKISDRTSPLREVLRGHLKTADLQLTCDLIEGETGKSIWGYRMDRTATWDKGSEEIIEAFQHKVARKLPYKK